MAEFRVEKDGMGEVNVPKGAYWGAQTQRAVENFPISGKTFSREFLKALGLVKLSACLANRELKMLDSRRAQAIARAAKEVWRGEHDAHFPVDVFQTGSGTSTNMNANEVIAHRANEILGLTFGDKHAVHPNDHVNMSQSSNDVIPTCLHVASLCHLEEKLLPALAKLEKALTRKAVQFHPVLKIGRTHLQDAVPMRLGQEFGGYASMVAHGRDRLKKSGEGLRELALGGTAVGTGLNAPKGFASLAIGHINKLSKRNFHEAENHFEAQGARDAAVEMSGSLKTLAVSLSKIANDIRWLGSGPRTGIGEIRLPAVQPGSSIMPGKVNPVMAEALLQVCAQVIGNDAAITLGGMGGNFELNVMMPLIIDNLLSSQLWLENSVTVFTDKCVSGLEADEERCGDMIEKSLAMATSLVPRIGYDKAAGIAKEAHGSNRTIREVARERGVLDEKELGQLLDPRNQAGD